MVLPDALSHYVPVGLLGILIAGLLAAFMSNFAATVNSAPPYLVNDIYRKFINPQASERTCVRLSYVASFSVVALGIFFGFFVSSIDAVIKWIVTALWGGYAASNVLKWYWWRFNGYGYFWGMVAGIAAAIPFALASDVKILNAFPLILGISLAGCLLGTLLTKPEDDEVLKGFYRRVRPWGFWGPVLAMVQKEDPSFQPNPDFVRDMFNVVVGIAWQTSLIALPIYVVIRRYDMAMIALAVVVVTSIALKFVWYDHLTDMYTEKTPGPERVAPAA
jgi:hypothetical protein